MKGRRLASGASKNSVRLNSVANGPLHLDALLVLHVDAHLLSAGCGLHIRVRQPRLLGRLQTRRPEWRERHQNTGDGIFVQCDGGWRSG
jgi:hypothetical protein